MPCRDSSLQLDTRSSFGTPGNVFEKPLAPNDPTASCLGNVCARCLAATHGEPVFLNTRKSAARVDELERNTQNLAIPTPIFARMFSTWNVPSHAEGAYPKNYIVEQPRNQALEMHFDKFPNPSTFQYWKTSFKTEVCSCSNFPTCAMLWIKEVEMVDSVDDLKSTRSIREHHVPEFGDAGCKDCVHTEKKDHPELLLQDT